ncbi:MAG TPA: FAD binding domain-containing protein [Arenibaculum sp.]|nr:FAD binding domain-containing protein [Arenibaculum sp.]
MMRLPKFTSRRPRTIAEAVTILAGEGPDAMPVAGGTDLYPNMKRRQMTPKTVVGLMRIPELSAWRGSPESGLVLGAGLTLTEIETNPVFEAAYPGVAAAVRTISTPQLRNMGTIGGNLCLDTRCNYYDQNYEWRKAINFCMKKDGTVCWVAPGSPNCLAVNSSDLVPVLCAMDAVVVLESVRGVREVRAEAFYENDGIAYLRKQPDELITEVRLPVVNGWRVAYRKLRRRGAFDFPVLGAAVWMKMSGGAGAGSSAARGGAGDGAAGAADAVVESSRIFLGAVASSPLRCLEAEAALEGRPLTDDTIAAAAEAAYIPAKPMDNTDHDRFWRKQMVRVWVKRAIEDVRGGG